MFLLLYLIRFIVSFVAETNRKIASEGNDTKEEQPNSDAEIHNSQPVFKKKPSYSNAFILKSEDTMQPNDEHETSASSNAVNKNRKAKSSDNSGI
jgi:hypothetical protein